MARPPVSRSSPVSWLSARTGRGRRKPSDACTSRWNSPCGTEKLTAIGSPWLMPTMPEPPLEPVPDDEDEAGAAELAEDELLTTLLTDPLALTRLPGSTMRTPARPEI